MHRQIPGLLVAVVSAVIGGWILSSTASVPHVVVAVVALAGGVLIFGAMKLVPRWRDWRRARLVAAISPDLIAAIKADLTAAIKADTRGSLSPVPKQPPSECEILSMLHQQGRVLMARITVQPIRTTKVPGDVAVDIASWEARVIELIHDPKLNLKLRGAPYTDPFVATVEDAYKRLYYQVDNLEYFIRDNY